MVCQRKRLPASEFSKKQAEPDRSTCSAVFRLRGGGGGEVGVDGDVSCWVHNLVWGDVETSDFNCEM